MDAPALTIGRLSQRCGCNVETIRYYERIGIMPAPPRTPGGHRLYSRTHLRRLLLICRSRRLGFTLKQVRELLRLVDGGDGTCGDVKVVTLEHLQEIQRRIADLQRLKNTLKQIAGRCDGSASANCPVMETLSRC